MTATVELADAAMTLFAELTELAPAERAARMAALRAERPGLAAEVASLLDYGEVSASFLDPSALRGAMGIDGPLELEPGAELGRCTVVRKLGSGGSGIVYLAEQARPRRMVAVKMLAVRSAAERLLWRLEREGDLLARLQHPGIAQVYEVSSARVGGIEQPYIVMEYIEGEHLDAHCDRLGLPPRERAGLVARVCDAVQHAHLRGVVHLDLKPANVLVDAAGAPRVLDFGVARATDEDAAAAPLGGTLSYVSPEQVRGDAVDARSDVYALGVVLYRLLTGRAPIDVNGLSVVAAARRITTEPPVGMSALDPAFRGDIESIVMRALAKRPEERYQSAGELADDLRRYLADQPVRARQQGALEALSRRVRRNQRVVTAAVAAAALCAVAAAVAMREADRARRSAAAERLAHAEAVTAREGERREAERQRRTLYAANIALAASAMEQRDLPLALEKLAACDEDLRGWEWGYLRGLPSPRAWTAPGPGAGLLRSVRLGGDRLLTVLHTGSASVTDLATGAVAPAEIPLTSLAFAPSGDGSVLVAGSKEADRLIDGRTFELIGSLPTAGSAHIAVSAAGERYAALCGDGVLRLVETRERVVEDVSRTPGSVSALAVNARADRLAVGGVDGGVALYARASDGSWGAAEAVEGPCEAAVRELAFSPDGASLAAAANDGCVRVWGVADRRPRIVSTPTSNKLATVAWTSDGRSLVTGGTDLAVYQLDAASGLTRGVWLGHTDTVTRVLEAPDGGFVSASRDGSAIKWGAGDPRRAPVYMGTPALQLVPTPTGVIAALADGSAVCIDGDTGRTLWRERVTASACIAASATSRGVLIAAEDGGVVLVDERNRVIARGQSDASGVSAMAVISDSGNDKLVLGMRDGGLACFDLSAVLAGGPASPVGALWRAALPAWVRGIVVTDGALIAGEADGRLHRIDAQTGATLQSVELDARDIWGLTLMPGGDELIACSEATPITLIDAATLEPRAVLRGHNGPVYQCVPIAGGKRLISCGWDNTVRVWDVELATPVLTLRGHMSLVSRIAFDEASGRLYSSCSMGELRRWPGAAGGQ